VSFSFFSDDKKVFLYPEELDATQRIYSVFGQHFYENILPVQFSFSGIEISGYVTHPRIHFQNKEKQVLFVNKRLVKSPALYKAIFDAYNRFIPHGTFP
jgi:DNA mismatch repair protein MutL